MRQAKFHQRGEDYTVAIHPMPASDLISLENFDRFDLVQRRFLQVWEFDLDDYSLERRVCHKLERVPVV